MKNNLIFPDSFECSLHPEYGYNRWHYKVGGELLVSVIPSINWTEVYNKFSLLDEKAFIEAVKNIDIPDDIFDIWEKVNGKDYNGVPIDELQSQINGLSIQYHNNRF